MPRHRLEVPFTLGMDHPRGSVYEVSVGASAGLGIYEDLSTWNDTVFTFAALEDLSLDDRHRIAPAYSKIWDALDAGEPADPFPNVGIVLSRAPLLYLGSNEVGTTISAVPSRCRIVEIGFDGDVFKVHLRRGDDIISMVSGTLERLRSRMGVDAKEEDRPDRTIERVARAATLGLVDGVALAIAFKVRDVSPGDWEASLKRRFVRYAEHVALASSIARALANAPAEEDEVKVEGYGMARRTRLAARLLSSDEDGDARGVTVEVSSLLSLGVPAIDVWHIEADSERPSTVPAAPSPPLPLTLRLLFVAIGVGLVLMVALILWH